MLNTYIYNQLPPTCFGVCYTIYRETITFLARKLFLSKKHNGLPEDGVRNTETCSR